MTFDPRVNPNAPETHKAWLHRIKGSGFYLCAVCNEQLFHIQDRVGFKNNPITFTDVVGDIDFFPHDLYQVSTANATCNCCKSLIGYLDVHDAMTKNVTFEIYRRSLDTKGVRLPKPLKPRPIHEHSVVYKLKSRNTRFMNRVNSHPPKGEEEPEREVSGFHNPEDDEDDDDDKTGSSSFEDLYEEPMPEDEDDDEDDDEDEQTEKTGANSLDDQKEEELMKGVMEDLKTGKHEQEYQEFERMNKIGNDEYDDDDGEDQGEDEDEEDEGEDEDSD